MLHVAPERSLAKRFKKTFEYISIDLDGSRAMEAGDITDLRFPDNHFDCIICNHVLEHVPEDKKAMAELFRVLKPGGWASLQVPIKLESETTDEDPGANAAERERRFGQHDHVRVYGLDYLKRLTTAGFEVKMLTWRDFLTEAEARQHVAFAADEMIFTWKP